jgi:hypothetical protein
MLDLPHDARLRQCQTPSPNLRKSKPARLRCNADQPTGVRLIAAG